MQQRHSGYSQHGPGSDRDTSPGRSSGPRRPSGISPEGYGLGIETFSSNDMGRIPTIEEPGMERSATERTHRPEDEPTAGRPRVRQLLMSVANKLGNAAHTKLDVSDYKDKRAHNFPEIPGEPLRNAALERVSEQYNTLREQNSRAESTYAQSIASTPGLEEVSAPPPHASPRPDTSPSRKPKRKNTLEVPTPVHIHRRTPSH
jgi:hypothetical protein